MARTYWDWAGNSTAQDFLNAANFNTGGSFWTIILYMFVVIVMLAMLPFGFEAALIVSLFLGIILGVLLLYAGLISGLWLGVLVALEIFIIVYAMATNQKSNYVG